MRRYGVPAEILTDNGKVFTGRFGPGTGEVLFDRICRENGIKHLLTEPRSPTTTGKVERWHKTLRGEFLDGKVFARIADAQAQLDAWVEHYNHDRPHQSLGHGDTVGSVQARPPPNRHDRSSSRRRILPGRCRRQRHDASRRRGRSVSPRRTTRSGCGSPVRTSRSSARAGWCRSTIVACSIATHARRHDPAKQAAGIDPRRPRQRAAAAADGVGGDA